MSEEQQAAHAQRVSDCQDLFINAMARYRQAALDAHPGRKLSPQKMQQITKLAIVTLNKNGYSTVEIEDALRPLAS